MSFLAQLRQFANRPDKNLPDIPVTDEEFLAAWKASGKESDGQFQLDLCKQMGSSVQIGDRMYKPTDVAPPE